MPRRISRPWPFCAILLAAGLIAGAGSALDSWVFRGGLAGEQGPMILMVLNPQMSLAYDERGGSLLLAWKGKADAVAGSGPIRNYKASGPVYHRRANPAPWSLRGPKGDVKVTVAFEGVAPLGELASLAWSLRLSDGRRISVRETPMFDDHYGDNGLFRNLAVAGIPKGMTLRLELDGRGMAETWGGGGDGGIVEEGGRRYLEQATDGETPLKVTWSRPAGAADPGNLWK